MLTQEQLTLRRRGIGGSDVTALSGLSTRWRPIDVWRSKVEPKAPECDEDDDASRLFGTFMERGARDLYAYKTKTYVEECDTIFHPEHELVLATPDGLVHFADGTPDRGLEIKCPHFVKMRDWQGDDVNKTLRVPSYYLPQVTWEAAVLGVSSVDVAVVFGHNMSIINVPFDQKLFESLLQHVERFWHDYVVPKREPPPDASESYSDYLRDMFPQHDDDAGLIEPDDEMWEWVRQLQQAERVVKEYEAKAALARNNLKARCAEAPGLDLGAYGKINYKSTKDRRVIDGQALADHLHVSADILEKFTTVKPGPRVFRTYFKGEM